MTREEKVGLLRFYLIVIAISAVTVVSWALFAIAYPRVGIAALIFMALMLFRWEGWLK